jgi:hypothetical protein
VGGDKMGGEKIGERKHKDEGETAIFKMQCPR